MSSINVRLPDELLAWIRQQAAADRRSINGQIVWLLEQARKETEGES